MALIFFTVIGGTQFHRSPKALRAYGGPCAGLDTTSHPNIPLYYTYTVPTLKQWDVCIYITTEMYPRENCKPGFQPNEKYLEIFQRTPTAHTDREHIYFPTTNPAISPDPLHYHEFPNLGSSSNPRIGGRWCGVMWWWWYGGWYSYAMRWIHHFHMLPPPLVCPSCENLYWARWCLTQKNYYNNVG